MRQRFKSDWLPEDIYAALKNPATFTVAYLVDGGFLIATRQIHNCGPVLFVWTLYAPLKLRREELQREVDLLARNVGAKKIRMHSPRKGWARWGYKPVEIVYEREVTA